MTAWQFACTAAPPCPRCWRWARPAPASARRAAQAGKSALNLAMVAEPPTLDIQSTPADLVCIIMQHVYEPLYTFDAKAALVPMLAESMPKISADGKIYSITLRKGVMLHSGRELNADDVVASLKRWMEVVAARQVGGRAGGRPHGQGPARRRDQPEERLRAAAVAAGAWPRAWPPSWPRSRWRSRCANTSAPGPTSSRSASPTSTCC